tara:strand:- start:3252 stop:5069 length:1818 start_codon:yes stop_codon:yes gene_type:complete
MAQEFESQFKPIVSGSDYLSGSEFGQVAGALLARRDKQDKKQAKKALLASAVLESFGTLQRNQKQDMIDAINETNTKYSDIFENNKEIFNNPINVKNRTNYQLYLEDNESYLHDAAVARFNRDPDLRRELGENPWLSVTKETLPTDDYNNAIAIYNGFKTDEENKIKRLGLTPEVSIPTFTKFNEAAKNEYLTAIEAVKNDPRKKTLIQAAWNRIFKTERDDKGELVSTNTKVIDLAKNLSDAKTIREQQENLISTDSSPENKENNELVNITEENKNINNLNKVLYINTEIERTTEFTTNKDQLKFEKDNFRAKVNKKDYQITEEDIGLAIEYNESIPGFPGLINLAPSTRTDLLSAITKINANKNFRPFSIEVGLNPAEVRAYALSLNQSPEAAINNELKLRETQAQINEVVKIDPTDVVKIYDNNVTRQRVESTVLSYMADNVNDDKFNFEGNLSTIDRDGFVYNVIEGALQLQEINENLSFDDALLQAIPIQVTGIYKFKDKPFFKRQSKSDMFRVEYVNMEVIDFMENKTLNDDRDAKTAVEYLNTKKYIQNRVVDEETKETLIPEKDKEFSRDGFRFLTINVGTEAAPQYVWTYERLPTQ